MSNRKHGSPEARLDQVRHLAETADWQSCAATPQLFHKFILSITNATGDWTDEGEFDKPNNLENVKAELKKLRAKADDIIYSPSTTALNGFAAAARSRAFKEAIDLVEIEELGLGG
ncbi:hypothetical protein [Mycobacterium phage CELFI]|uniref:Uncharacterized protein n=1 Tax=Mycobacterium phage CELFI TaxID=2769359 RepID=A0A7G9V4D0_9CAUD|nr:hypothetical protein J4T95_gp113 [Mycobacterium phage CELFI]QNO01136.1 hypothetical protein [Mycobacterium phage CELFI]